MMTPADTSKLLKRINAYDGRKIDDEFVFTAWFEAAQRGRWTYDEAADAVSEFFNLPRDPNSPRRWLEPGHITHMIRSRRGRIAPVREVLALRPGGTASAEHRAAMRVQALAGLEARGVRPAIKARQPRVDAPALPPAGLESGREQARALLAPQRIPGARTSPEPSRAFSGPEVRSQRNRT